MPRLARGALAAACVLACPAGAQARHGSAEITVDITPDSVRVYERVLMAPDTGTVALRALSRPCAEVANVRIERSGTTVEPAVDHRGPWTTWTLPSPAVLSDTLRLDVRYDVILTAAPAEVPLLHPTMAFARDDSSREGHVTLRVQLAKGSGTVHLPSLVPDSLAAWSGRFIAVPSFVSASRLSYNLPARCGDDPLPGNTGGLVWRFALLVGIMVAWVPLYLAWARRSQEDHQ